MVVTRVELEQQITVLRAENRGEARRYEQCRQEVFVNASLDRITDQSGQSFYTFSQIQLSLLDYYIKSHAFDAQRTFEEMDYRFNRIVSGEQ